MAQNQHQGGSGQSGRNPNTNNSSRPKVDIRATADVSNGIGSNTYKLLLEVILFRNGHPLANQEVILKEGLSIIDTKVTDDDGMVILEGKGNKQNDEQNLNLRIFLTGLQNEKAITVKIPAIKKTILTEKKFVVKSASMIDQKNKKCVINFECRVFDDNKPFSQQRVFFKKGLNQLGEAYTDNNGQVSFQDTVPTGSIERIETYRFGLFGFPDEEEVNVNIETSSSIGEDNDPTDLHLMSHNDGNGNFKVKVRILKMRAIGLANKPFSIWYKGVDHQLSTNDQGEYLFEVPGVLQEGDKEQLIATVSGIDKKASITLRRRKKLRCPKPFSANWWLGCNNGRAFILFIMTVILWGVCIYKGFGDPMINADLFRNEKQELAGEKKIYSPTESFYQETMVTATGQADKNIGGKESGANPIFILWSITIGLTIFTLIYIPLSAREEIAEATAEVVDKLFSNPSDHVGDPALEKLAQTIGTYSVIRRESKPTAVNKTVVSDKNIVAPATTAVSEHKHPENSVLRFIGIDLAIEIALSVLKKVFTRR